MELTLKLDDGTIIASDKIKVESAALDYLNGDCMKVNVSFLTDGTTAINALFRHVSCR